MALLRHTTGEIKERSALTVNPAKTCQPVGAMYAALGVKGCFPHSHGSQGCCAYHRSALTRHYKEPVVAGTSSFTEGSSVFGGQSNLISAIDNLGKGAAGQAVQNMNLMFGLGEGAGLDQMPSAL